MKQTIQEFRKQHGITLEQLSKGCPEKGIVPINYCVAFLSRLERCQTQGADYRISKNALDNVILYFKQNYNVEIDLDPRIMISTRYQLLKENKKMEKIIQKKEDEIHYLKYQIRLYEDALNDLYKKQEEHLKNIKEVLGK